MTVPMCQYKRTYVNIQSMNSTLKCNDSIFSLTRAGPRYAWSNARFVRECFSPDIVNSLYPLLHHCLAASQHLSNTANDTYKLFFHVFHEKIVKKLYVAIWYAPFYLVLILIGMFYNKYIFIWLIIEREFKIKYWHTCVWSILMCRKQVSFAKQVIK